MDLYGFDGGRKKQSVIQMPAAVRNISDDVAGELLVPEYKPEIRRALFVCGNVTPPAHYISGGHAEFAGNIEIELTYEGADGSVVGISMPLDYGFDITIDNDPALVPDDMTAYADAVCESVTARVTAPRRVALRARVSADATVLAARRLDAEVMSKAGGIGAGEDDIKRLCRNVACARICRESADGMEYSDTIRPADGGDGEVRVITCRAMPFVTESAVVAEGVAVRGNICISLLYCRLAEGARPILATAKIPFAETVGFDMVPPAGSFCRAWGSAAVFAAEVTEGGEIDIDTRLALTAEVLAATDAEYTADIYSLSSETELLRRDISPALPLRSMNANITVSGMADLASLGLDSGIRIVWAEAEPISGGKREGCVLSGNIRVRMLADNGAEVRAVETEIPYRYTADLPADSNAVYGGGYSECDISVPVCRARVDGERIAVDCELAVAARFCGRGEISAITEAHIGDARAARAGNMTVCYPSVGETLWDIGRRYGKDAAAIAEANRIPMPDDPAAEPIEAAFLLL